MTDNITVSNLGRAIHAITIVGLMLVVVTWMSPGLSVAQGPSVDQPQLVQVVQSRKSFPETIKSFTEEVGKAGWSLLNVNNMAGVLSERGFTVHPVVIMDVCSGKHSVRILGKDEYRPVSALMPCRVSIYQTSDGRVFIARMNSGAFAKMMLREVGEVMAASDKEIGEIVANTVR